LLIELVVASLVHFDNRMFFWLKKLVAFWMMPLSVCVTFLVAGLWLMRYPRCARLGRMLALGAAGLLILLGNHFVARALVRPLETHFSGIPDYEHGDVLPDRIANCQFVVVLGAGSGYSPKTSATNQLGFSGVARITEGVRIMRLLPEARLIVSGPSLGDGVTHATRLARAAISLGVPEDRIIMIDQARDTEDEARLAHDHIGTQPVVLVTSASHMPRAMALFRGAGVSAVPCPAGFNTQDHEAFTIAHLFFDADSLGVSTAAWHEYIGLLWGWLRGKT